MASQIMPIDEESDCTLEGIDDQEGIYFTPCKAVCKDVQEPVDNLAVEEESSQSLPGLSLVASSSPCLPASSSVSSSSPSLPAQSPVSVISLPEPTLQPKVKKPRKPRAEKKGKAYVININVKMSESGLVPAEPPQPLPKSRTVSPAEKTTASSGNMNTSIQTSPCPLLAEIKEEPLSPQPPTKEKKPKRTRKNSTDKFIEDSIKWMKEEMEMEDGWSSDICPSDCDCKSD